MMTTMRAAVLRAFGAPLAIEERPIPVPGPGEVLVRVVASGVCHTDLHAVNGDWPVKPALPLVPGHEAVGHVAALGSGVTTLKEGDPVGVPWLHDACGGCEYCETGWETLCDHQHNTGYGVDGGYADYVLAPAAYVGRLPERPDFVAMAPILCAGVTTYKGLKETEARPGEWVAISGIGGLGHVAIQYAKAMGLHVAAIDVAEDKLALARQLGADVAIDAREADAAERVRRETGGGAHGVLVTAPSPPAFQQAIGMVRKRGTVALVGLPAGSFPLPIFDIVLKRITVRGSIVGTRRDLDEALAFAAEGHIRTQVTTAPLENVNAVLQLLADGRVEGRVVLSL
ncbi:zinc-dependent alcohol dehydrogenase [Flavisphingomonas formosensis]|uniref:zinc-dependent alcohol dehydrogenase n=1 Tax=Flavisphingomonas formosensis TaxID=861534 RepID=UPI0012FCA7B9|nr:zinc-dependent alcohol dehydrogenase [Sphingomonas formosensis]